MIPLPCPNCGSELAYLEQYHRQYCYACGRYAPEGFGDRGAKMCPTCTSILSHVAQYDRYYCYRCNAYPADGVVLISRLDAVPVTPSTAGPVASAPVATGEPAKPAEPSVAPAEVAKEPAPQPEQLVEEEIPREEPADQVMRPALVRGEILEAKKPVLMDLSKAYDLDPSGTKEQLRERLLSYLEERDKQEESPEVPQVSVEEAEAEAPAETAPAFEGSTSAPEPEPSEAQRAEESQREPEPSWSLPAATMPVITETRRPTEDRYPTMVVTAPEPQPVVVEVPVARAARTQHPCPTCGRELTFISQYNRWYCYHCKVYAPATKAKFACPTCGATLRWIRQYERWWCDSCRHYAPADLPKPERASVTSAATGIETGASMRSAVSATVVHRHRNPGSGIGLVGFGMVLFVVYEVLVDLPAVLSLSTGVDLTPDLAFGLRFFAFVFVAAGAILGLSALRDRR